MFNWWLLKRGELQSSSFFCVIYVIYVIYVIGDWGFLWEAYSVKNPGNFSGGRELYVFRGNWCWEAHVRGVARRRRWPTVSLFN